MGELDLDAIRIDLAEAKERWTDPDEDIYSLLATAGRFIDHGIALVAEATWLRTKLGRTQGELMKALETIAAGSALRQTFVDRALQAEVQLAEFRDRWERAEAAGSLGGGRILTESDTHVAVPRDEWALLCNLRDKAKAWHGALFETDDQEMVRLKVAVSDLADAVDALDENDPREEADVGD